MSLYLTEIQLDYEAAVKAGLRDNYAWHRKIWMCFPGRPDAARDFLTRLDPKDGHYRLLMLSATLPERPPWCPTDAWRAKEVPDAFLAHPAYRFSLVANPTQKLVVRNESGERKKNGRRVPIVHRDDRRDETGKLQPGLISWLKRKAEVHGFTFDPDRTRTIPRSRQYFVKDSKLGLHTGVEFEGSLSVTDADKFREAFFRGIGSGKAFGFGMLVLAPFISHPTTPSNPPTL
jgi:CRISPR system Cascade subunit CasE